MTPKERLLAILNGHPVDRPAFSPFLSYWWEAQDDAFTDKGELEFLESIGADPLFRGHYPMTGKNYRDMVLFKRKIEDCRIEETISGNRKEKKYITSKGTLTFGYQYVSESNTWFLVDHPVKEEEDFELLIYIMDNTTLEPDYEEFDRAVENLGDRGLLLPIVAPELKSSFQSLLETWVGTEELVYAIMDYPELVERTMASMRRVSREAAKIAAASSSPVFLSWEDTSTTNISPQYYEQYILPEINEWCDILHASGKLYIQHACGQLKDLMDMIASSKIDCLESLSPAPTGNVEILDARKRLPESITVIGGIEPTILLNSSEEELEKLASELLDMMQGYRYVLANSDSCPPGVTVAKFELLAKLAQNAKC